MDYYPFFFIIVGNPDWLQSAKEFQISIISLDNSHSIQSNI